MLFVVSHNVYYRDDIPVIERANFSVLVPGELAPSSVRRGSRVLAIGHLLPPRLDAPVEQSVSSFSVWCTQLHVLETP